jgi:hypothetical protein
MKSRIRTMFLRLVSVEYTPRYSRLAGDMACFRPQLEKRIVDSSSDNTQWAKQARLLLDKAEEFLMKMKLDEGWKAFHTAQRLEVNGMSEHERIALGNELIVECSKLNDWRKNAILRMLGPD